jgi:uncharacterized protein (DUF2147 family)
MTMRTHFSAAVAALSLGLVAGASPIARAAEGAGSIDGLWMSQDKQGIVEIATCADTADKCGRIVWLKVVNGDDGKPLRDEKNSDATQQKRPICGIQVLSGFKAQADGGFAEGTLYDPEEGQTYKGTIKREGGQLKVTGFLVANVKILSETETWTAVTEPVAPCGAWVTLPGPGPKL